MSDSEWCKASSAAHFHNQTTDAIIMACASVQVVLTRSSDAEAGAVEATTSLGWVLGRRSGAKRQRHPHFRLRTTSAEPHHKEIPEAPPTHAAPLTPTLRCFPGLLSLN